MYWRKKLVKNQKFDVLGLKTEEFVVGVYVPFHMPNESVYIDIRL